MDRAGERGTHGVLAPVAVALSLRGSVRGVALDDPLQREVDLTACLVDALDLGFDRIADPDRPAGNRAQIRLVDEAIDSVAERHEYANGFGCGPYVSREHGSFGELGDQLGPWIIFLGHQRVP